MLDLTGRQDLLDALPMASVILDDAGVIVAVNKEWKRFADENGGDCHLYYVGKNYLDICGTAAGDSASEATSIAAGIRGVIAGTAEFRAEYPCHSDTDLRWFEVFAGPIHSVQGRQVLVSHLNVTKRRLQQDESNAARASAHQLAALVASSSDAIISYNLDGVIQSWNRSAEDLYGYSAAEAIGRSMEMLYPDGWPLSITDYRDKIIAGDLRTFEAERVTKDGVRKIVAISAAPVLGADGEIVALSNINRDVTAWRATEERLKLVTQELRHRTKNMFAIIAAIERQTAAGAASIEDFHEAFSSRLSGMAAANDLLIASAWQAVSLEDLCRSQIEVFTDRVAERVEIGGPRILLNVDAVEAIGLSLHELATNATKYGAIANDDGQIEISWSVEKGPDGPRLSIIWSERSGSINAAPNRNGFGHFIVTHNLSKKLRAEVTYEFADGVLEWCALIPSNCFRRDPVCS